MAMVYLSNRNISPIQKEPDPFAKLNNELRSELEELNVLLEKKGKENRVPFNSQAKGHDITFDSNIVPGPGTYNLDQPKIIKKEGLTPFLFKSQRFKKIRNEFSIPGPGSYNLDKHKFPLRKNKSQLRPDSNISLHNNVNSLNNVATIPAKKQEFGYNIDNNGDLVLAADPIADFCFSGTKTNSIGPGRYNPIIKEKIRAVRWDKSSGRKPDSLFGVNTDNLKNEMTKNSSLINTEISTLKSTNEKNHVKKPKPKYIRMITYKSVRSTSNRDNSEEDYIDFKKEMDFLTHKNNIISGPKKSRNYLLNYNIMRHQSKPDEYQFFGSSNERNTGEALILNDNPQVGPGSYFRSTYKKFENLYLNRKNKYSLEYPKGRNDKENEKHKLRRSLSNLGPGSYDIDRSLEKKSFNSFGNFSTEKRFDLSYNPQTKIENNEELGGNPGPGSYNVNDPWMKDYRKMIKKPILVNVVEEMRKKNKLQQNENKPDFNIYQKDKYINIIQEKIKKKRNPFASENMPFLSGDNRFKYMNSDFFENIGPGAYNLYKKGTKAKRFHSILVPFNSLEERKPLYIAKGNNNVAPGEHRKDSYFDWNKKSFNTMFIN